jgi:hypothetical protein
MPMRVPAWRATAYPVIAPIKIVAIAEGKRSAKDVTPSRCAKIAPIQK